MNKITTKITLALILFCFSLNGIAQKIDGDFAFQTDPSKKYSLYIPSNYDADIPTSLMVGLHPWNTNRWDAKAWRDTLIVFAEENNLILACPDGGPDGKVDDDIDTSFTSVLIDSVQQWYNIDKDEKYLMGFSWGGKTCYSYGLRRTAEFRGYLIIGAAVTLNEVAAVIPNSKDEAFYLVHGSQDSQAVRYTPMLAALQASGACVDSQLLPGVGHTIDFPNRNKILNEAFSWLQENSCLSATKIEGSLAITLQPNPFTDYLRIEGLSDEDKLELYDIKGKSIDFRKIADTIIVDRTYSGQLLLRIVNGNKVTTRRLIKL